GVRPARQRRPGRWSLPRRRVGPSRWWPSHGRDQRPDRRRPRHRSAHVTLVGRTALVRAAAVATVAGRLARGFATRPPLARATGPRVPVSVVVPARDEADRIGPLLAALRDAPGVAAVIVVDDRSTD